MDWDKVFEIVMKLLNIAIIVIIIWAAGQAADWFTDCSNKDEIVEAKRKQYEAKQNDTDAPDIPRCVNNIDMLGELGLKFGIIYILATALTFATTYFNNRSTNKEFDKLRREKLNENMESLGAEKTTIEETESKVKVAKEVEGVVSDEGGHLNPLFEERMEDELQSGRSGSEALDAAEDASRESDPFRRGIRSAERALLGGE